MIYNDRHLIQQAKQAMIPYIQELEASRRVNEALDTIPVSEFTNHEEVTTLMTYTKEEKNAIEKLYETALYMFVDHPQTTLAFYQWIYNTYNQAPSKNMLWEIAQVCPGYDDKYHDLIRWLHHSFAEAQCVWESSHLTALR